MCDIYIYVTQIYTYIHMFIKPHTHIYTYIYISFQRECLNLVLITAEKSYELKCQTVKWNASDQFSIVKGEMALPLVLK